MASAQQVCPVVGTKNTILPPSHPDFDADTPGLVCPVTNATTDHHHILQKHPGLPGDKTLNAQACPALKEEIKTEENRKLDEGICPVVGPVSTVLPPDHPATDGKSDVCPVTKASLKHHTDVVHKHPKLEDAPRGAVCPVVGAK
eukprot:c52642_g1_i1.p1 GENE.c52642_g1_i1~~c52642_g1_i1.p1  ORF type:complete len:144 (+),score=7.22 c52642_g1_i1:40-471(+)